MTRALLHPPLLYALGRAFGTRAPESAQGGGVRVFGGAVVVSAWAADVLNLHGEDDPHSALPVTGALAASYPLWFWLGWDAARRRRAL